MRRLHFILIVILPCFCMQLLYAQQLANKDIVLKHYSNKTNLTKYLDERKWNELFPNRNHISQQNNDFSKDFYSLKAFVAAAQKFPMFLADGNEDVRKRELCAFLANIAQETSGGWDDAPGGYFKWGLYYLQEQGCENGCMNYSDTNSKEYPPVKNISYHGRGPKQLSWNYNYGQFSLAYYGNKDTLLQNPNLIIQDAVLSFASAIWFWMTAQNPKPSCHDVMTGKWTPTEIDIKNNRLPGFGATVNIINGGLECGKAENSKTAYRYEYYKLFCNCFNVAPGDNIECTTQKPFYIQ